MNRPVLKENPFRTEQLEAYRRESARRIRASMMGAHITRRRGQSLEFREFGPYTPGDDFRHIDWRASARASGIALDAQHLLVRRFIAEERFRLVLSIDARESMWLPEGLSKFQVAAWLAECLAWIALRRRDEVGLHNLFGEGRESYVALPSGASLLAIRHKISAFLQARPGDLDQPAFKYLLPNLPPTSIWVIISDLYFRRRAQTALTELVQRERDNTRWVIIAQLDSWDREILALNEKALTQRGSLKIVGPDLPDPRHPPPIDIDKDNLDEIKRELERRYRLLRGLAADSGFQWTWPEEGDTGEWFRKRFFGERILRRVFMGEP